MSKYAIRFVNKQDYCIWETEDGKIPLQPLSKHDLSLAYPNKIHYEIIKIITKKEKQKHWTLSGYLMPQKIIEDSSEIMIYNTLEDLIEKHFVELL